MAHNINVASFNTASRGKHYYEMNFVGCDIVDPIDAAAVKFYRKYDFIEFHNSGRMFILVETINKLNL